MQSAIKYESRAGDGKILAGRKLGSSFGSASNRSSLSQHQGRMIWSEFRKLLRQQADKNDNGFLQLSGCVKSLCERYGTKEGMLDKVSFAEAVGDLLGHSLSTQDVDSAFEICDEEVGLNGKGSITAKELVTRIHLEEKEQQHLLMKLREKIKKKIGKRDRYMKELYEYLAASTRGEAAGAAELCDVFEEFLKVDLAETEAWDILHMMNFNGDGVISLDDFMAFMGPQGLDLLETNKDKLDNGMVSRLGEAIVDVKVSTSSSEEVTYEEQDYDRVEPNVNGSTGKPVYLWYKKWSKDGGGARLQPIVDFLLDSKSVNSALVADGYQCIQKNLRLRNTLYRPKYLWIRRAATEEEGLKSAVGDIAITTGKAKDRTSKIHNPPCGVFVHVPGNLNGGVLGEDVFLWYKPVKKSRIVNGKRVSSYLHNDGKSGEAGTTGFHISSTLSDERRREQLRNTIRRQLRQHVLNHSAGRIDYAGIFNRFDSKGRGKLKRSQVQKLLSEVGLNLDVRELNLFMGYINAGTLHGEVSRDAFLHFIQLTEDELDGVCKTLRRRFDITKPLRTAKLQREQIKELRSHYESLDADGDGVLSHKEFANMFEVANIFLTVEEVESIRNSRFDIDGDGRVDFLNFLQFFFSKENKEKRSAVRVSSAIDVLRNYILSLQKLQEQDQNAEHVDSTTGWTEIRKRHMSNHRYFNGYLVAEDIEMALQKLNVRLSQREIHQTVQRIAPLGNGHITEQDFHQFVCVIPRSIGELLKIVEKDVLPMMVESYRRLRLSRMRQVHQKRTIGRTKGSSSSSAARELSVSCCTSPVHTPINFGNMANNSRPWSAGTRNRNKQKEGGGDSTALQCNVRSRDVYTSLKENAERSMKCNAESLTTVENVCTGLCENGKNAILDVEWVILSQFVGSDIAEKHLINGSTLLEGLCMVALDEDNGLGGINLEEMLDTNEEALNLVCEDLIKTIQDEARLPDGSLDYSKPFTLFDENGDGIIPIDEFRNMLYRLNVDIPLREKQVIELMNRFDTDRSGFISLKEFEAFVERRTWKKHDSKERVIEKQDHSDDSTCKVQVNNTEDGRKAAAALDIHHPSRFEGYLVTGNRTSDAFIIGDSMNITTTAMVAALNRAGLVLSNESDTNLKAALRPLCLASGLLNTTEFITTIMKAWRILLFCELRNMGTAISGSEQLDKKLAKLQAELQLAINESVDPSTNKMKLYSSSSIESAFNSVDTTGDGLISSSQLQEGFKLLGFESYFKHEELHQLFQIFNSREDNKISYIELCEFLQNGKFNSNPMAMMNAPSDTVYGSGGSSILNDIDLIVKNEDSNNEFDELFENNKRGDEWTSARVAMEEFCPTHARRQKIKRYLESLASNPIHSSIPEDMFRRFLYRAIGPESLLEQKHRLSYSDLKKIIRLLSSKSRGGGEINYDIFLQRTLQHLLQQHDQEQEHDESACVAWRDVKIHIPLAIVNHVQDSVARAALDGKAFHTFFHLSDTERTGLVSRDAFRVTLSMLGCRLSDKAEAELLKVLPIRSDGMIDYEALYRLLINNAPPPNLTRSLYHTSYNGGGGMLSWPIPPIPPNTQLSPFNVLSDSTFENIAARVRQIILEEAKQWGPIFSLSRQFQFYDPHNQGITTTGDFFKVLEQLSIQLSGMEVQHLQKLFDRYCDGTMDYQNFCFRVLFNDKGTETFSKTLCASVLFERFLELRRNGMDIRSVFEMFDPGKTGFICRKDFRESLKRLRVPVTDHQVQCMQDMFMQLGDVDAISYEEFLTFVASSNPPLCRTVNVAQRSLWQQPSKINHQGSVSSELGIKFQRETLDHYMPQNSSAAMHKTLSSSHRFKGGGREIPSSNITPVSHDERSGQVKKMNSCATAVNDDEWTCPVCFYSSNVLNSQRCEICAAPNSGKRPSQVQRPCHNCTYGNDELEVECGVCGEPLTPPPPPHGHSKQREIQQQRSKNIGNKYNERGGGGVMRGGGTTILIQGSMLE